jgi:AcrR family transcriptional regulator
MMAAETGTDMRQVIIDAAHACFREYGLRKTTVVDIGRVAGVSRSTIYSYFRDKAAIVEACAESTSYRFYREMAKAMDAGQSLEDKLSLAASFVWRARRHLEPEKYFDEDEVGLLLTKNAGVLLRECVDFVAPYLKAAILTGEIRKDVDVQVAGEVFARLLFSLFGTPSSTLDLDDPEVVRRLVCDHVVRGLANDRWIGRAPSRRTKGREETVG